MQLNVTSLIASGDTQSLKENVYKKTLPLNFLKNTESFQKTSAFFYKP